MFNSASTPVGGPGTYEELGMDGFNIDPIEWQTYLEVNDVGYPGRKTAIAPGSVFFIRVRHGANWSDSKTYQFYLQEKDQVCKIDGFA